jgi:hypothetical protein
VQLALSIYCYDWAEVALFQMYCKALEYFSTARVESGKDVSLASPNFQSVLAYNNMFATFPAWPRNLWAYRALLIAFHMCGSLSL